MVILSVEVVIKNIMESIQMTNADSYTHMKNMGLFFCTNCQLTFYSCYHPVHCSNEEGCSRESTQYDKEVPHDEDLCVMCKEDCA